MSTWIITASGTVIGPFNVIETLADRLRCDGKLELPLDVISPFATSNAAPALTASQVADAAEAQRLLDIDTTIKGDTTISMLKAMNNADFDAWWTANVTSLAQASVVLKRIARVVLRRVL